MVQHIRNHRQNHLYLPDVIQQSISQIFDPTMGRLLVLELSIIYYAFVGWFLSPMTPLPNHRYYSYYRKTGYAVIVEVLLFSIATETLIFHLLINIWSETAAWLFTALGIYGFLGLVGDFQAIRNQPIVLTPSQLHLRIGLRFKGTVSISNIIKIADAKCPIDKAASGYINCVAWGDPNLIIDLSSPVEFTYMFGKTIEVKRIGICIDEKESFKRAIQISMASC